MSNILIFSLRIQQPWSVGARRPLLWAGAQDSGGTVGDAHELCSYRRLALCLHQWWVSHKMLAAKRAFSLTWEIKKITFFLQVGVTFMCGDGMKAASLDFHHEVWGNHHSSRAAHKKVDVLFSLSQIIYLRITVKGHFIKKKNTIKQIFLLQPIQIYSCYWQIFLVSGVLLGKRFKYLMDEQANACLKWSL